MSNWVCLVMVKEYSLPLHVMAHINKARTFYLVLDINCYCSKMKDMSIVFVSIRNEIRFEINPFRNNISDMWQNRNYLPSYCTQRGGVTMCS